MIENLLLLEHSPAREPRRGWIGEIVNFRREIDRRLCAAAAYGEVHLADRFPERCPYTLDQVLGDFWPNSGD